MAPTLYMIPFSQPVRATLMAIKALGLDVNLKEVDLKTKQQHTDEYLKLNPQHTVPTLVDDDGFVLYDSHAIMQYLIEKYRNGHPLYPNDDPKLRARISQRMHFECGILFPRTMSIIRPILYGTVKEIPDDKREDVIDAYRILEKILEEDNWVAGSSVTIADFSVISSITTMDIIVPIDSKQFPKISAWIKRMEALPYYEPNRVGTKDMRDFIEEKLKN